MILKRDQLRQLMKNKLMKAGLSEKDANITSETLAYSDARGWHSHGAVRVEYYSERIAKGGINTNPNITWKKTGPCSGILDGDNGVGFTIARMGMQKAIEMAKENGVAIVGMRRLSHSGSIGYYCEMARDEGLIGISMCQSDPMAVPFGGSEPYYGTNPIAISAPSANDENMMFDMATTVQAWGKVLDKRSKGESIPSDWAVDEKGNPTTNPHEVNALMPIAGAKGYGLMMFVDILSGVLLGVPFGGHVSSMYHDLSVGRELGQIHIVIDPERFVGSEKFKEDMTKSLSELNNIKPAPGYDKVYYPGQRGKIREEKSNKDGIEIPDEIVKYLKSDDIHYNRYDHKNRFAE
ncbi:MAG: ureidoglycolate dehydrogenase [Tissierellia bacterium]|nr:ureidoglycolate dehydrogenase [Tissierellia bacterium]